MRCCSDDELMVARRENIGKDNNPRTGLARESSKPWAALVAGDREILDRLRSRVQGALSAVVAARP